MTDTLHEYETDFDCDWCGEECGPVYSMDGHQCVCENCMDALPEELSEAYWKLWDECEVGNCPVFEKMLAAYTKEKGYDYHPTEDMKGSSQLKKVTSDAN